MPVSASFPLQVVIQGVDRLTAPLKATQAKVAKALEPLRQLNNSFQRLGEAAGLDRVGAALGQVGSRLSDVGSEALRAGTRLAALTAGAAGGATALVLSFSHAGAELVRMSAKLNVGIGTLQEWRHAARLAEVDDQTFERSLNLLAKNAGLAAAGAGPARVAFRRLGVDVRDSAGRVRTLDELLPEVADKLNDLTDPGRRTALTTLIFGRGGADLLPLLKQGSAGLKEAGDEARRLGIVLSDDAAERGHAFVKAWVRVQAVLLSVRNTIAEALLPVVGDLVNELRDWLVSHREEIGQYAKAFARELPRVLREVRDLVVALARALEPLGRAFKALADRFGAANVVAAAFALLVGGRLLFSIAAVVPSLINLAAVLSTTLIPALVESGVSLGGMAAAAWAALAPIAAVIAAVGSLAYLAVVVRDNWSALSSFFQDMWDDIRFGIIDLGRWLDQHAPFLLGPVGLIIERWVYIRAFFQKLWADVRTTFDTAVSAIAERVQTLVGLLPDWVVDLVRGGSAAAPTSTARAPAAALGAVPGTASTPGAGQASVRVSFENAPRGTRVRPEEQKGVDLDLSMGYAFAGAP